MITSDQEYQEKLLQLYNMDEDDIDQDLVDELNEWERKHGLGINPDDVLDNSDEYYG